MKYAVLIYAAAERIAGDDAADVTCLHAFRLLAPETATTLRLRNGTRDIVDGPHADVAEQLGAVFVIEAPDLDAALDWAAQRPDAAHGSVEMRPLA